MAVITDIPNTRWRDELLPARFRQAMFHVEAVSRENGRRIVVHEFPKKEFPYAEDMGRRAIEWNVRGYCIAYPVETGVVLYQRDYRQPRNALIAALEQEGPGELQMPTLPPMKVRCHKYSIKEEEKYGGFCTFDMSFVEFGVPPNVRVESSRDNLLKSSQNLNQSVLAMLKSGGVRV